MKREEKNRLTRQRIMDSAVTEFAQRGYAAGSINTICASEGISKGIIYHYFETKDELYLACVEECFLKLTEFLQGRLSGKGTPQAQLECYFSARAEFFHANPVYQQIFCEVVISPPAALAAQIAAQLLDDSMTEMEKAQALYTYLTGNVQYDRRYHSDRNNMPYDSQTAVGALRDNLAICGGDSHALKLLLEQAGITCYNVTGKCGSENHMWNIARIDSQWLWFDATSDRGLTPDSFRQFALTELDPERYTREQSWVDVLLK